MVEVYFHKVKVSLAYVTLAYHHQTRAALWITHWTLLEMHSLLTLLGMSAFEYCLGQIGRHR